LAREDPTVTGQILKLDSLQQFLFTDAVPPFHLNPADSIAFRVVCERHALQRIARSARVYIAIGKIRYVVERVLTAVVVTDDLTERCVVEVLQTRAPISQKV
jgi:hypothetical protein